MNLERNYVTHQLIPFAEAPQKRLHPTRIARQYFSGEKLPTSSTSLNTEATILPLPDDEQEEESALKGIMIHWMIDGANRMRKQRPPYGLIYLENGLNGDFSVDNIKIVKDPNLLGDPFTTFSTSIRHTFAHTLEEKRKQIFTMPDGHEAAIFRKYMEYVHRNGAESNDPYGIKFIVFSSNFALRMMGDILANASDIDSTPLGRKVTIDESASAARNSTPLIVKLSSFEQGVFDTIYRSMAEGGIWRSLTIVEHAGEMSYQIKDPVLQAAITQLSKPDIRESVEKNKRAGCPARMRFEGKESAIRILWDWYIDYSVEASQNA